MIMRNSCLTPFYEYILKNYVQENVEMPKYEQIVVMPKVDLGQVSEVLELQRKRIWNETKTLMLMETEGERIDKLQELGMQNTHCGLCLACQKCQQDYWEQLRSILLTNFKDENIEKSALLLPEEMHELLKQRDKPVDIYLDGYKRRSMRKENYLVMLKGFSSSTPILLNYAKHTSFYSGGGFYFRWNGLGIVIDPGYLFVQNLHDYGLSVLDINVVIVTHEHIDHSSDIRLLDDLHYNVASGLDIKEVFWDNEKLSFERNKRTPHKIKWFVDEVTYADIQLFVEKGSGFSAKYNEVYCVVNENVDKERIKDTYGNDIHNVVCGEIKLNENVLLKPFPTRHEQYEKDGEFYFHKHTFGCVFECYDKISEKRKIGYTSDTSLQPDIYEEMNMMLVECDIIISNISGIYEKDLLLKEEKARHLGYYGCYKLVHDLFKKSESKLKYFLLSEFSNQISDIRYGVSRYMQQEINELADYYRKNRPLILPTEIGLTIGLTNLNIMCTTCNEYSEKVHILKPSGENENIEYICPKCMYTNE